MSLIEVRPIDTKKWHGKKGKETFARPFVLEALYDPKTGGYATGLTEELRIKLEKKTGFDLSDTYSADDLHPFWNSKAAQVSLPARTTIFNTKKAIDFIKVSVLKASKYVANSQRELEQGLYPEALFVIFDEIEEATIKASKIQKKRRANKLATEMSAREKINIIQILAGKSLKEQSQDFLDVEIDDLIEQDINSFLQYAEMDKKEIYNKALVLEAIYKGVLTKEGSAVLYIGDRIGFNVEEAINYIAAPENQQLKAIILEKLNT